MEVPTDVAQWCRDHLEAAPERLLWAVEHLSWVAGLALCGGREVVVRVRDGHPRLGACHVAHAGLWSAGFPCPRPLTAPLPLGGRVASAESHLPGGRPGRWDDPWLAAETARALRELIDVATPGSNVASLEPPPPWTGWLDPRADPWPPPDEGPGLNDHPATATLRSTGHLLNERLRATALPLVVGHSDWYQGNLRWERGKLFAADDWDSIAALPEAAFVGCSAVSYLPSPPMLGSSRPGADVDDTAAFLEEYTSARGTAFSQEEEEVAWAAGLWQRVFDGAKALAAGRPKDAADQVRDATERLRLAGC